MNMTPEMRKVIMLGRDVYNAANPDKVEAWRVVRNAVVRGDLVAGPCADCGSRKEGNNAHHEDYSKPMEVVWLCPRCHKERHLQMNKELGSLLTSL